MTEKFIQELLKNIETENFSFYLYGSAGLNASQGRDIDGICLSPDFKEGYYSQLKITLEEKLRLCNLYFIPNDIFLDDVYKLKYGGYYSHKFALSFKEILKKGDSLDAPLVFWTNEYRLYSKTKKISSESQDSLAFIKYLDYKLFKYKPDFGNSLTKFISDHNRIMTLQDFITSKIFTKNPLSFESNSDFNNDKIYFENQEKMFYNFWSEYCKYKDKGVLWGENTFLKLKRSLEEVDYQLIKKYFNLDFSNAAL